MNTFLSALSFMVGIAGTAYMAGYFWSLGKSGASKHKKVCDVCFRDIEKVNRLLRDRELKNDEKN